MKLIEQKNILEIFEFNSGYKYYNLHEKEVIERKRDNKIETLSMSKEVLRIKKNIISEHIEKGFDLICKENNRSQTNQFLKALSTKNKNVRVRCSSLNLLKENINLDLETLVYESLKNYIEEKNLIPLLKDGTEIEIEDIKNHKFTELKLLKEVKKGKRLFTRNRLVLNIAIGLQFLTGLRINEVATLTLQQLKDILEMDYFVVELSKSKKLEKDFSKKTKKREIDFDELKKRKERVFAETKTMIKNFLSTHKSKSNVLVSGADSIYLRDVRRFGTSKRLLDYMAKNRISQSEIIQHLKPLQEKDLIEIVDLETDIFESGTSRKKRIGIRDLELLPLFQIGVRTIQHTQIYESVNLKRFISGFNEMLKDALSRGVFDTDFKKITSHDLRRNFVVSNVFNLMRSDKSKTKEKALDEVKDLIMHSNLETTKIYYSEYFEVFGNGETEMSMSRKWNRKKRNKK